MRGDSDPEILRIGTAEREEACRLLSDHLSAGRLQPLEYEDRVTTALAAHTRADIRPLFADLPAPRPVFLVPPLQPWPDLPPAPPVIEPAPSERSYVVAGLLQIVLPFGSGRFYTGHTELAVAQLLVTLFTLGVGAVWPLIDGIMLLINGGTDAQGRPLRE
ncbi:DUF1707 domain-containing protein [Prauserella cavernicola]|uniref:DUF1707 domain-containing protein n=1 Tax=Prauserella cavernicola TaxID=2800127 RepID=A0A934V6Z0_9PSEU|nr:DUF1707 domain-containing protein [Prauserella cavernicola]MBK1788037.1 DUF1707 domain-containing protein [Prauserella cavernicola]